MINFKSFLTEARAAPLYHGTDSIRATSIIEKGSFNTKTVHRSTLLLKTPLRMHVGLKGIKTLDLSSDDKSVNGLSLSRSWKFALNWAMLRMDMSKPIVFELDQAALSQRYQIKPISYWTGRAYGDSSSYNEFEEFVISDKPIPLKYVTKIYTFHDDYTKWLNKVLQDKNIKIPVVQK